MGLVESGNIPKPLTWLMNYGRKYSLWMFQWGPACCAIEMAAALASPRYDMMRLGVIPFPASPRQADRGRHHVYVPGGKHGRHRGGGCA